jgi:hypothetical protein
MLDSLSSGRCENEIMALLGTPGIAASRRRLLPLAAIPGFPLTGRRNGYSPGGREPCKAAGWPTAERAPGHAARRQESRLLAKAYDLGLSPADLSRIDPTDRATAAGFGMRAAAPTSGAGGRRSAMHRCGFRRPRTRQATASHANGVAVGAVKQANGGITPPTGRDSSASPTAELRHTVCKLRA